MFISCDNKKTPSFTIISNNLYSSDLNLHKSIKVEDAKERYILIKCEQKTEKRSSTYLNS